METDLLAGCIVLWSQGMLIYMLQQHGQSHFGSAWSKEKLLGLSWVAALVSILQPSMQFFCVFCVLFCLWSGLKFLDAGANAQMYLFLVTLNIASGAVQAAVTGYSEALVTSAFAGARGVTILLYFFAGLAKVNRGFFDIRHSAGTQSVVSVLQYLPDRIWPDHTQSLLPGHTRCSAWLGYLLSVAAFGAVALELTLPFVLWFGWRWAILLDLALHLMLGIDFKLYMFTFSIVMFAVVPVLWAPGVAQEMCDFMAFARSFGYVAAVVGVGVLAISTRAPALVPRLCHLTYLLWSLCLFVYCCKVGGLPLDRSLPSLPLVQVDLVNCVGWFSIFAMLLTGVAPYLGLKTHLTLTMFSNLRLEGGQSNHYLIPASLQVFRALRDVVVVKDSNHPAIRGFVFPVDCAGYAGDRFRAVLNGIGVQPYCYYNLHGGYSNMALTKAVVLPYAVPYLQLRLMLSKLCSSNVDFYVQYEDRRCDPPRDCRFECKGGTLLDGSDVGLARPLSWLAQKLLTFRSFPPDGTAVCIS